MKTKHTQGEWKPDTENTDGWIHSPSTLKGICKVDGFEQVMKQGVKSLSDAEAQANAKLIAAAPELLEALEACSDYFKYTPFDKWEGLKDRINTAIKKATE